MKKKRFKLVLVILIALLLVSFLITLCWGTYKVTPLEVIKSVLDDGYIPSYCTACYRRGRTGERFMKLAKSGEIQNVCEPNAMTTLLEFAIDYGDKEILEKAETVIKTERKRIKRDDIKELLDKNLERLRAGERDLYL